MIITSVPLSSITDTKRIREDYGDLTDLKESLSTVGLLQPVGVRERGDSLEVIWGGRRVRAAQELGWTEIEAKILVCEEDYNLREMELEENIRRKDMTWQEQVASLYEIHRLRKARNAKIGEKWGFRETGSLLGVALGNVSYSIAAAEAIRAGDPEVKSAHSLSDAIRILTKRKEAELMERKLQTTKASSADKENFFSEKDLEEMKKQNASSKDRLLFVRVDPALKGSHYIVYENLWEPKLWQPGLIGFVAFLPLFDHESMIQYGGSLIQGGENAYSQLLVMQDLSAGNNGMPLKDQMYGAFLFSLEQVSSSESETPFLTGNNYVERAGGKYPRALDRRFIQKALEVWVSKTRLLGFRDMSCPTYVEAALLAGYKCVIPEMTDDLAARLANYGNIVTF